jgi:hypothetical protein
MTLHEQIKSEIKEAMKEKNQVKLGVVRGLVSAFMNEAVAKGYKPDQFLNDEEAIAVCRRISKQRQDSINQFKAGGREDLAESEQAELAYIETYLPKLMGREEIKKIAQAKLVELGNPDKSQAGKVTGTLMKDLKGKADGADVKAVVDELLV